MRENEPSPAKNQVLENTGVNDEVWTEMDGIKKILNMKVDPYMCMKTQGG